MAEDDSGTTKQLGFPLNPSYKSPFLCPFVHSATVPAYFICVPAGVASNLAFTVSSKIYSFIHMYVMIFLHYKLVSAYV